MKVKQAMHKGVQWVDPGTSVEQLARLSTSMTSGPSRSARTIV